MSFETKVLKALMDVHEAHARTTRALIDLAMLVEKTDPQGIKKVTDQFSGMVQAGDALVDSIVEVLEQMEKKQ